MSPISDKGTEPTRAQAASIASSPSVVLPVAHPPTVEPAALVSEQSLDSPLSLPHVIPKGKSGFRLLIGKPLLIGTSILLVGGLVGVGIVFMLNNPSGKTNLAVGTTDKSLLETLSNPGDDLQNSVLHINLDTIVEGDKFIIQDASGNDLLVTDTANSRIGIGGFPEGEAKLQVLGDIMATGTLLASGGSTMLSDQGLRIGSVLVCTAAGCIAAPSSTPVPSTSTSTTTIIAPERPLDADTLQGSNAAFFLNATNISSGTLDDARLSVNITKAGNSFNGPLQLVMTNATGELPAISGINLTNVNATTLGGNNSAYYTNASNLSSGTVGDGRLSGNVAMRNAFNLFQATSNSTTSFQIQNAGGTSTIFRADTTNDKIFANHLDLNIGNNIVVLTLPSAAGSTTIRGAAAGDFFGTYISGNIKVDGDIGTSIIRPNQASDVGLTVRGRASQSGNLLNLRDNNNTVLASVSGTGNALFQAATNSATAFQIQNAAGTSNLFMADTTNSRVGIGATPANSLLTIGTNTTTAAGGIIFGTDTNLYRASANTLRTDDELVVSGNPLTINGGFLQGIRASGTDDFLKVQLGAEGFYRFQADASGSLLWGSGAGVGDTNLYRSASNQLRTDDTFNAAGVNITSGVGLNFTAAGTISLQNQGNQGDYVLQARATGDSQNRFVLDTGGTMYWGPGNAAADVNLYRSAANLLATDDEFRVIRSSSGVDALSIRASGDTTNRLRIEASGALEWGPGSGGGDTLLYRSAANTLKTDDNFNIQTAANSATAFQIQNSTGTALLSANTTDMNLQVSGDLRTTVASATTAVTQSINVITIGGASSYWTPSMTLGTDGFPWVAFYDPSGGADLRLIKCGNATCTSGNVLRTLDTTNNVGRYVSIKLGKDGLPVMAYHDATGVDLKVAKCNDATCSTSTITTLDSTGNVGYGISLAVPADGLPVISYQDLSNNLLKVFKCSNAACTAGTASSQGINGRGTSIAIGTDGYPVISHDEGGGSGTAVTKCNDASCTSRTTTIIDSIVPYQATAMTIGRDGLPVIAYGNTTVMKVAKCGNSACSSGNIITTIGSLSQQYGTSIANAPDGNPLVFYQDGGTGDNKAYKCNNLSCSSGTTTIVEGSGGNTEYSSSMTFTSDGLPLILYGVTTSNVHLTKCANIACSSTNGTALTVGNTFGSSITPIKSLYFDTLNFGRSDARVSLNDQGNFFANSLQASSSGSVSVTTNSTNAFQIQNAAGSNIFIVDTTNSRITLGTASATPVLLVLGDKNTSGDPTCTHGAVYYNSSGVQAKVCLNGNWTAVSAPLVTSLPATPADGDEVYYQVDSANGIYWHLRYRAGSGSTYKWEFLGGPPLLAEVSTQESFASSTYIDLATAGPSVTVPIAGDYNLEFGAEFLPNGGPAIGRIAPKFGAAATSDSDGAAGRNDTWQVDLMRKYRKNGLSASTVIKLQYRAEDVSTHYFSNRWIEITPVRVL